MAPQPSRKRKIATVFPTTVDVADIDASTSEQQPPVAKRSHVVYFDKLAPREPFTDINTTRMDNVFRASCFKNAVCTITTNLHIDIKHFTNLIGGQLTSTLPGNRLVLVISGQRYSVICYESGKFVLTNLFFFNRLKDIYDYFINFCLLLIKRGIATLNPLDDDEREGWF